MRKIASVTGVIGLLIFIGVEGVGLAATYHVTPGQSIAKAIGALRGGDTLLIQAGTYTDGDLGTGSTRLPSGSSWAQPTRIQGQGRVILQPSGTRRVFTLTEGRYIEISGLVLDGRGVGYDVVKFDCGGRCGYIRLKDMEIKNGIGHQGNTSGMGILGAAPGLEFINVDVHHNTYGIYTGAHGDPNAPGILLQGSKIHHNAGYGLHLYADGGGVYNNTIAGNEFYANNQGPVSRAADLGVAMIVSTGRNNRVCGNVVHDNRGGLQVDYSVSDTRIEDNTITDNGPDAGIYIGSGARNTQLRGNTLQGNPLVDHGQGTQTVETAGHGEPCARAVVGAGPLPPPANFRLIAK